MKFSLKMTLFVIVLIALCLSLNGFMLINTSFEGALAALAAQNAERHYKDAYQIEREAALYLREQREAWFKDGASWSAQGLTVQEIYASRGYGEMFIDYALQRAGKAAGAGSSEAVRSGIAIRLSNGSPVYTAMPPDVTQNDQITAAASAAGGYSLVKTGGAVYMLISSPLLVSYREASLVSAFDVGAVFASRDAQLKNLMLLTCVTLALAVALVAALSGALTRPLGRLKAASERVAGGDYAERTAIKTDDEIGALSGSFDRMAEAVEEKVQFLNESVREREDFVSAFTHEIKTPMTSMLGYAALLRKGEQEPAEQRAAADYIWRETGRLEALSQKLMLLMGLKDESLALEAVSVSALFNSIQKTLPASARDVEVAFKTPRGIKVLADRTLLDDLLRNLIINAQRACASGGRVEVGCNAGGGSAALYVSDDGRGIPADELARITEPFYMVDKSRARAENGSGMGLALGARIAELHGSRLEFQSEVGRGTTVSLSLPLAGEEKGDE